MQDRNEEIISERLEFENNPQKEKKNTFIVNFYRKKDAFYSLHSKMNLFSNYKGISSFSTFIIKKLQNLIGQLSCKLKEAIFQKKKENNLESIFSILTWMHL